MLTKHEYSIIKIPVKIFGKSLKSQAPVSQNEVEMVAYAGIRIQPEEQDERQVVDKGFSGKNAATKEDWFWGSGE